MRTHNSSNFLIVNCLLFMILLVFSCKTSEDKPFVDTEQIVTAINYSPKGLNPIINLASSDVLIEGLIFFPLADYNPETLEFEPILIDKLPVAQLVEEGEYKGKIKFDLKIIDQAMWSDSTDITGQDYLFTLKTIFHNGTNAQKYRAYMTELVDCEVHDNPKEFSVYLNSKSIADIELITSLPILPKHIYDSEGILDNISLSELKDGQDYNQSVNVFGENFNSAKFSREIVQGSGRYNLKEWVDNQYVILEKKPNHFFQESNSPLKQAVADELVFTIVPDEAASITKLKSGSLDFLPGVSYQDMKDMKNDETYKDQFNFESVRIPQYYYLALNTRQPELSDVNVRKALARLIDVDTIISTYENGLAERINSPILSVDKDSDLKDIDFDRKEADSLLAASGWVDSNGNDILDKKIDGELVELDLTFTTTGSQLGELITGLMKQSASLSGINIEVETVDKSNYLKKIKSHDFDITSSAARQSLALYDPYPLLHTDNTDPGEGNVFNFGNNESDQLIEFIRSTDDDKKRNEAYLELEKMLQDQQPIIFLYSPMLNIAYKKNVQGVFTEKKPGFAINTFKRVDHSSAMKE